MNFSYYGAFTWMPSLLADQFGSLTKSFGYRIAISIAQLPGYFPSRLAGGGLGPPQDAQHLPGRLRRGRLRVLAGRIRGPRARVRHAAVPPPTSVRGAAVRRDPGNLPDPPPVARAAGAAAAVGRIAAIIAPLLMPWFLTLSGGNKAVAFIIFAAAFIIACVAALCLPERKGLDLED